MKKDMEKFLEQENIIEEVFYNFMIDKGYGVNIYNEDDLKYMGYGGFAVKEDKYGVIFRLCNFQHPKAFTVFAVDRNGYFALDGDTAAIYSITLDENTDMDNEELKSKFEILLEDIYTKYSTYSKSNRLDFVFNDMEIERKSYEDISLNKEELER